MKRIITLTVCAVTLFSLITVQKVFAQLANSSWPMLCHDGKHSSQSKYKGPDIGSLKWKFRGVYAFTSPPSMGIDGTVYIGSYDDYLYALYPDGTLKWKFPTGNDVISSPAIGTDGTIYFGSNDKHIYAVNGEGTLKWKYNTSDEVDSSPAIGLDGTIYVCADEYLSALNPNGSFKWSYRTSDYRNLSSPAIDSIGTIFIGGDDNFYAINPDGSLKWKYDFENESSSQSSYPSIGSDNTVYFCSGSLLYALAPDGKLRWKFKVFEFYSKAIGTYPAIGSDGIIYVGVIGSLYAINPDGSLKWKSGETGYSYTTPSISSDGIIFSGDGYGISSFKPDGTLMWKLKIGNNSVTSPSIGSDSTLYFGSDDGCVYAIGIQTSNANVPPLLTNGTVLPPIGYSETEFVFRVNYFDPDNDPPISIVVVLLDDVKREMLPSDPTDNNYVDGCLYEYKTKLSTSEHKYAFSANDGFKDALGDTNVHQGPIVVNVPIVTISGNIIHVPSDYPIIQLAIDASRSGDTILVDSGIYYEHLDYKGKSVVIKSASGVNQTIIDGYQSGTVVKFVSNEDARSVLEGFKITNGKSTTAAGGILISSSPTIKNNWIVNNEASGAGGGIYVYPLLDVPYPIITGNVIENNRTSNMGGGICAGYSVRGPTIPTISHNIIRGNTASFRGGAIALANTWGSYPNYPTIFNNLIVHNSSGIYIANSQTAPSANVSIGNNTIAENSGPGIYTIMGAPVVSDCIIWGNNDDLNFTVVSSSTIVRYSDIKDGDYSGTNGNISIDPLFVAGPRGQYYLSQTGAGQAQQSPCVNSGSLSASATNLRGMTTRTDGVSDEGQVDMGYHFSVSTSTNVEVKVASGVPKASEISQNYPNPFNPETMIQYQLLKEAQVRLDIYDVLGKFVRALIDEKQSAGYYTVRWNGRDEHERSLPSGVYFYRLQAGQYVETRKLVLLR